MKKGMKMALIVSLSLFIIFILLSFSLADPKATPLLQVCAILGLASPLMIYSYVHYRTVKIKESMFPFFLLDLSNDLEIGMSLPSTIDLIRHNDYKKLSKDIYDIHKKMTWGVPFAQAFEGFCVKSGSSLIKKAGLEATSTLSAGGELSKVLNGVAMSMLEYQEGLKKRKGRMFEQMLTGYMVFVIFLGIIFVVITQLIPLLEEAPLGEPSAPPEVYRTVLFHFCLIEAICISLVVGEMAEGSITAGFKHALVLVTLTVIVFAFV